MQHYLVVVVISGYYMYYTGKLYIDYAYTTESCKMMFPISYHYIVCFLITQTNQVREYYNT